VLTLGAMASGPDPGRTLSERFRTFASRASDHFGSHWAFAVSVLIVLAWVATGPIFGFSDAWQLVINTATTIVTFLMVFLIQATQNRDAKAIHLKLDELIRSSKARNTFADLENASEAEIEAFRKEFRQLREKGVAAGKAAEAARRSTTREPKQR
jgi:low affinity Fe/Cu permease